MSERKATVYLSHVNVGKIKVNMKAVIVENYDKSKIGLELNQMAKKISDDFITHLKTYITDEEVAVFRKFHKAYVRSKFSIVLDQNKGTYAVSTYARWDRESADIYCEEYHLPADDDSNAFKYISALMDADILKEYYTLKNRINCEINDIVEAYLTVIAGFKTVRSLLEAHPEMEKFIPSSVFTVPKKEVVSNKEADKKIAQFEELFAEAVGE